MSATLRFMSWNLKNYGQKRYNYFDLAPIISRVIQIYAIDICALIEISNNGHEPIRNSIAIHLKNSPYKSNWRHTFVNVGDEGVAFIWHEAAAGANNAFRALPYENDPGLPPLSITAGPVMKQDDGKRIFFPKTQTTWASLVGGQPQGRRAAYCAFETNDGAPARRFSCLDIHTPFNAKTFIQAYSTTVYARSQEMKRVESVSPALALTPARVTAAANARRAKIDALLTGPFAGLRGLTPGLADAAAAAAAAELVAQLAEGVTGREAVEVAAFAGSDAAFPQVQALIGGAVPPPHGDNASKALAMAGAATAAYLMALIQQPTGPAAATASPAKAAEYGGDMAEKATAYTKPNGGKQAAHRRAVQLAARNSASDGVSMLAFGPVPTRPLDGAVAAGDFNVDFPDTAAYTPAQRNLLQAPPAGTKNAYGALQKLAAPTPACIPTKTTRIGPTAFEGQRVYSLIQPATTQTVKPGPAKPGALPYVPIDLKPLAGKPSIGYAAWMKDLQELAKAQGLVWATLVSTYATQITAAFNSEEVISDTLFYRANAYDNIFLRGAKPTGTGGVIDVMSELGTWSADPKRPWAAARGGLTSIAEGHIKKLPAAQQTVKYYPGPVTYQLDESIGNAEAAAVYFDKFISDHLPVYVEFTI